MNIPSPKKPRGFAAISKERHLEICRNGGVAVAPENRSFSKNPGLAAETGRKGGQGSHGGGRPKKVEA